MENHEEDSINVDVDATDRQEIARYLNEEVMVFLSKLDNIWDVIGTDSKERKRRGLIVIDSVKDLLDTMLEEADTQKNDLLEKITFQMEQISRLGKQLHINTTDDIKEAGYECMPFNTVYQNLQEKLNRYQEIFNERLREAYDLNERGKSLCISFGKETKLLALDPLPSRTDINNFQKYLDELSEEINKRKEIFFKAKIDIIDIMNELEIKPSLEFEKKIICDKEAEFVFSDENMEQLDILYASLYRQQKEMHSKIAELREKISISWERLEEPPEIRSAFLEAYPGNNKKAYHALKKEDLRCNEKIRANIKIFIDKMRQEIEQWWERCYYSDNQKNEFTNFHSDCYTEDLLSLHEIYIDSLKNYFEKNKNIFDLISKRTELWTRLMELEKKAIDPDRFKNRGGQLLREEKERNSVRAQLPKVEQQLVKLVETYESENRKPFLISGRVVTDIITQDWDELKENRHIQLSTKKQARELLKTPLKSPGSSKILAELPYGRTLRTPNSPSKRRLAIPLFGSLSTKKNKSSAKKMTPKMTANASMINKRVSLERRKRLERRKLSRGKNSSKTSSTAGYKSFEMGLENNKTVCRSTLQIEQNLANNNAGPSCTPNIIVHTPSRSNLQSRTPSKVKNRLTPASSTRPIII